ncbi:MAG: TIGR03016 family PEP-CTERM system-associated outer membrane protein [Gammaproteobacteria bacterium]|nr:TIGR03016 family PEP-CTERM system-associated outer membrane protein [Gammaproteobacteria bacterium]
MAVFICVAGGFLSFSVTAGTWTVDPSVGLVGIYTDNVNLESSSLAEDDFVHRVTPAISVSGIGSRMALDLDYRLQSTSYTNDEYRRDSIFHRLRSVAEAELVKKWLFVDANASLTQENVDPGGQTTLNNFSVTNNRVNVSTVGVSPYVRYSFNRTLSSEARYSRNWISSDDVRWPSSSYEKISINVMTKPGASLLGGKLEYVAGRSDTTGRNSSESRMLRLNSWYPISYSLQLLVDIGSEQNEFGSEVTARYIKIERTFWFVGLSWRPGANTLLEGKYGERFFGKTYSMLFSGNIQKMKINVNYAEDISTVSQLQLDVINNGQNNILSSGMSRQRNGNFVYQRLTADIEVPIGRNYVTIRGFSDTRDFQVTNNIEQSSGGTVMLRRALSRRSDMTLLVSKKHQELGVGAGMQENEILTRKVQLKTALSRRLSSTYAYWDVDSLSTINDNAYKQKNVSIRLSLAF